MLPKDLVEKFQKRGFQVQTIDSRYVFTRGDLDRKLIVEFPLQSSSDFNFGVCERQVTNPTLWHEFGFMFNGEQLNYFGIWMECCFDGGKVWDCHTDHPKYKEIRDIWNLL